MKIYDYPIGTLILEYVDDKVDAVGLLVRKTKSNYSIKWSDRAKSYSYDKDHYFLSHPLNYQYEAIEPKSCAYLTSR